MIQSGGCFSLSPEMGFDVLVTEQVGRKELQGGKAFEVRVLGPVNNNHPTFTEFLGTAVMGDSLADHVGPILPLRR